MKCNTCNDKRTVVSDLGFGCSIGPCPSCNKNGEASKTKDRSDILKKLAEV